MRLLAGLLLVRIHVVEEGQPEAPVGFQVELPPFLRQFRCLRMVNGVVLEGRKRRNMNTNINQFGFER